MIHICNWQKNYSATYLGLVPDFEERPGCVFSPNILDVDLYDRFFQPTSDGNISETVGLINLKLSQIRAHIHGQNL